MVYSNVKLHYPPSSPQYDEDEMELTLEDLGLTRREILYVEERD